jgi:catechol 2,3-dioxygenase-like lactoylglutathione lyase family enzyme
MALLNEIHHLTSLTADMDRLIAFYERVFDARVTLDMEEEGLRHAFIELGPNTVLHPFQVPGLEVPQEYVPTFERGRLDHFGLNAASEEAFWELRRRVMDAGAGDGLVTDMRSILSFGFIDPDGNGHEVIWVKPGVPDDQMLERSDWTTIEGTEPEQPGPWLTRPRA